MLPDVLEPERILPAAQRGQPPPHDIRETVVRSARLAGFRPFRRQPLPGPESLGQGWRILPPLVRGAAARQARAAP